MKVLAIDSSLSTASVSILEDFEIIGEIFLNAGLTHSQTLAPIAECLIKNCDLNLSQIDLFAVTSGPGSFTGLRIGMSLIKGMALPYKTPCIEVSSLFAIAYEFKNFNGIICACIDARRGEVYNALFRCLNSKIERISPDRAILMEDLKEELCVYKDKIKLVGDAAEICYNTFKKDSNINLLRISFEKGSIKASSVGFIAIDLYEKGKISSAMDIRPTYLKLSQAERMLRK